MFQARILWVLEFFHKSLIWGYLFFQSLLDLVKAEFDIFFGIFFLSDFLQLNVVICIKLAERLR